MCERHKTYNRYFRRDSAFATEPLPFRDVWDAIAVYMTRDEAEIKARKEGRITRLDARPDYIRRRTR